MNAQTARYVSWEYFAGLYTYSQSNMPDDFSDDSDSSSHDSGSDVGCHYQDRCMEKAITFLVLQTVLVAVIVVRM